MDVLHHLGVHEAQSFLLTATDEQRTVHLNAVDIDRVLVKRTAAYVVLATEFVGLAHTGKGDEKALNRSSGSVRHDACRGGINAIHSSFGMLDSAYLYLAEHLFVREHLYVDIQHFAEVDDSLLHAGIAYHRVDERNSVRFV